jgi:hypothetical protein
MFEWADVWKFLAGFLAGFSVKWILNVRSSRNTVQQHNNVVGGHLAGHNITTESRTGDDAAQKHRRR